MTEIKSLFHHLQQHFAQSELSSPETREAFLKRSVLSVSGLRFICGHDEESADTLAPQEALEFVICAAAAHIRLMRQHENGNTVWLGADTRPTGVAFLIVLAEFYRKHDFELKIMGQGPIPQIMAACHQSGAAGFCYLTASHNPKGHNGLKLGLSSGAVIDKSLAEPLIAEVQQNYLSDSAMHSYLQKISSAWIAQEPEELERSMASCRTEAKEAYRKFVLDTISEGDEHWLQSIASEVEKDHPYFLIDMNGSSRLLGIDLELLQALGFKTEILGREPGIFNHAILPEGVALTSVVDLMQQKMDQGDKVFAALVPDCDGDRGNLILPYRGKATALKAQETFLLCALAEVSSCRHQGYTNKLSIAVNGATSLRVDHMLSSFSCQVERAEVGEANVISRAQLCRQSGARVPLCGEGSNGGSIITPSTVRDPLLTTLSLIKFLYSRGEDGRTAAEYVLDQSRARSGSSVIESVLDSFPDWITTETFENDAKMPVPDIEHETLKTRYEANILQHFTAEKSFWLEKGIDEIQFFSFEGTQAIPGPGGRPAPGKGGLAIYLYGERKCLGFLWMRGSGTEPVFRVAVDWSGAAEHYPALMGLHRELIQKSLKA